jgi:hypothetical protein
MVKKNTKTNLCKNNHGGDVFVLFYIHLCPEEIDYNLFYTKFYRFID